MQPSIMESMKILLAGINARYTHSNIAIRYLRNQALAHPSKPETVLREFLINQPVLDILEEAVALEPDVLLVSVYIWNSSLVEAILPDLRSLLPRCIIILGGPEVSYSHHEWLQRLSAIDLVVSGPGEGVFAALLDSGFDLSPWPGKVAALPPPPFAQIPSPWLPGELDELPNRYIYLETSRGCPFACSYCLSSREDQALEEKSAPESIRELESILASEPLLVKFVDRTFNAHPERARKIWSWLISWAKDHPGKIRKQGPVNPDQRRKAPEPEPTRFHFEIQGALLEEEDYALLATAPAGLFQFEMGVQTSLGRTLGAIGRRVDWKRTREAAERVLALGNIHLHLDMIVGLPGESFADVGSTFNDIAALGPQHFQIGFLKALPGTALREEARLHGMTYQRHPPYQILANKWLSNAELSRIRRIEKLADSVWASGYFAQELNRAAGIHGGLFQALDRLQGWYMTRGLDLQIRERSKLAPILEEWLRQA